MEDFKDNIDHNIENLDSQRDIVCTYEECDHRFLNEELMKDHVIRFHESEDYMINCGWPGCHFRGTLDNLWQHQFIHRDKSKSEPIVCNSANCDKSFINEQILMEHINDVHKEDKELSRQQSINELKFSIESLLFSPKKSSHNEPDVSEESANKGIASSHDSLENFSPAALQPADPLTSHESGCQNNNQEEMNSIDSRQLAETSYDCSQCGQQLRTKIKLEDHINVVHNYKSQMASNKTNVCPEPGCHYRTCDKSNFRRHCKVQHGDPQTKLSCYWPECTYSTFDVYSLRRHIVSHTDDRPFGCEYPECDKRFKTSHTLKRHFERHTEFKNYFCDCGKKFKTHYNRCQHIRAVHKGSHNINKEK